MATIKEIAALAGVSRGTVDRVLNNRGSVSSDTAEKIREIAKALDYRPNKAGLALAAQKKKLKLGVILFSTDNPFFADVLKGINEKSEDLAGYNCAVLVRQIPIHVDAQLNAIDELVREEVNGIALAPCNDSRIRLRINDLFELGIPVITFNTDIESSKRIAYVGSHYRKSGATAAGLLKLMTGSHVQIGIITGSSDILCHTERIAGFVDALAPYSEQMHIISVLETHDDEIESYEQTSRLLKEHPEINALFFAAGGVYGGCRAISALGLSGRLRVIAFDKADTTEQFLKEGTLSAVICQQPRTQGKKPLDLLFAYLTSGELPEKEYNYTSVDIRILENI
ncbi:MAG: LacI family DNA-binding transcriptional regulator [Lachnospiraceae bacterium]|nr:LacI family DNA-binding transcriptional regulator [Lachnospiraceae bacterium]MBO5144027.1 LacI family DNA-binding transcriptional regulator [Lachnospiraceae bacterium]